MTQEEINAILNKAAQENTAITRDEIEKMSGTDRLYTALKYGYDKNDQAIYKEGNQGISDIHRGALSRNMQRSSFIEQLAANRAYKRDEDRADNRRAFASEYATKLTDQEYQEWQKAFQQQQFDWQKESADRQLAASYVQAILAAGGTPSDDLLARANISSADYSAMKPAVAEVGGGGGGYNPGKNNKGDDQKKLTDADLINSLKTSAGNALSGISTSIKNLTNSLQKDNSPKNKDYRLEKVR